MNLWKTNIVGMDIKNGDAILFVTAVFHCAKVIISV